MSRSSLVLLFISLYKWHDTCELNPTFRVFSSCSFNIIHKPVMLSNGLTLFNGSEQSLNAEKNAHSHKFNPYKRICLFDAHLVVFPVSEVNQLVNLGLQDGNNLDECVRFIVRWKKTNLSINETLLLRSAMKQFHNLHSWTFIWWLVICTWQSHMPKPGLSPWP